MTHEEAARLEEGDLIRVDSGEVWPVTETETTDYSGTKLTTVYTAQSGRMGWSPERIEKVEAFEPKMADGDVYDALVSVNHEVDQIAIAVGRAPRALVMQRLEQLAQMTTSLAAASRKAA